MEELEQLTSAQLFNIVNTRTDTNLTAKQENVRTIGREQNLRIVMSLPNLPDDEVARAMAVATTNSTDVRQVWSSFTILVNHVGGMIFYTNISDEDCVVEITF